VNIIDILAELRDAEAADSGGFAAYDQAIGLIERIENLNLLAWKLNQLLDAAEESDASPEFRERYKSAVENARQIVLQLRIDDE
jgi:hypothetical protein